jgi:hypothetical protein
MLHYEDTEYDVAVKDIHCDAALRGHNVMLQYKDT